ncbi:MAG: acyl carrier protein [Myxococcaceae bacterium]
MEQKLAKIFHELFKQDPALLSDGMAPGDIRGWDSLGHLTLVDTLEATFGVSFQDGDLSELDSVGSIKKLLRARGVTE